MLKKIKKGVKRVMKESVAVAKSVCKSLINTKTRTNAGFTIIAACLGGIFIGGSMILTSYLENGGTLYKEEVTNGSCDMA